MKPKRKPDAVSESDEVVLLEDLTPTRDVRGGAGKLRFGQSLPITASEARLPDEENAAPRPPESKPPRRGR